MCLPFFQQPTKPTRWLAKALPHSLLMPLVAALMTLAPGLAAHAQSLDDNQGPVEVNDSGTAEAPPVTTVKNGSKPQVGRRAAARYMGKKGDSSSETDQDDGAPEAQQPVKTESRRRPASVSTPSEHYMAVHVGAFLSDNAWLWGEPKAQTNVGGWNFGVTYRIGEWVNSMDLAIRVDALSYNLHDGRATKLSFMPAITFPDASARFPLYFGAAAGLGVFVQQLTAESPLSFDYSLFGGVRFFDVLENTGFFIEGGLKNHFLLLSDGQYNGIYTALGCVFTF